MSPRTPQSIPSKLLLAAFLVWSAGVSDANAKQPDDTGSFDDEGEESEEAESAPAEPPDTSESPVEEVGENLDSLRAEYFKLRDRLFQSRARASAVASALYSTRLSVNLNYDSARYYTVTRASIRLDGASIFEDTNGEIAGDSVPRFEGFIAPGRHQLSIRIEATGKDDDRFTTIIDNSFVVQANKDKDLEVTANAADDGNIAYAWSKKERGSYKLQMDVSVKSVKRSAKGTRGKRTGEVRKNARAAKQRG